MGGFFEVVRSQIEEVKEGIVNHRGGQDTHLLALIAQSLLRVEIAQAETNNLLRGILKVLSPTYHLEVTFHKKGTIPHMGNPTQPLPTETGTVGQQVIGVPTEFQTTPEGVTTPYVFDPTKINWSLVDTTVATVVADPATGQGLTTLLKAGTTNGTVTDSAVTTDHPVAVSLTFTLTVTEPAPNTFTMDVTWHPVETAASTTTKPAA